jgi:protein arginine kinase activator
MEFKAEGRLGCPRDYDVFREPLAPLLERIHRATQHRGKQPPHARDGAKRYDELRDLRAQLRHAIAREAFEDAARLRDAIREKEAADERG